MITAPVSSEAFLQERKFQGHAPAVFTLPIVLAHRDSLLSHIKSTSRQKRGPFIKQHKRAVVSSGLDSVSKHRFLCSSLTAQAAHPLLRHCSVMFFLSLSGASHAAPGPPALDGDVQSDPPKKGPCYAFIKYDSLLSRE